MGIVRRQYRLLDEDKALGLLSTERIWYIVDVYWK